MGASHPHILWFFLEKVDKWLFMRWQRFSVMTNAHYLNWQAVSSEVIHRPSATTGFSLPL